MIIIIALILLSLLYYRMIPCTLRFIGFCFNFSGFTQNMEYIVGVALLTISTGFTISEHRNAAMENRFPSFKTAPVAVDQ